MPRDRRARRSLPSAVERNLSLRELLGDDDAKRHARRRKSQEKQHSAALESLNAVRCLRLPLPRSAWC
jgi:hypothetical protein